MMNQNDSLIMFIKFWQQFKNCLKFNKILTHFTLVCNILIPNEISTFSWITCQFPGSLSWLVGGT